MRATTPIKELTSKLPALLTYTANTTHLTTNTAFRGQRLKLQTTTYHHPGMVASYTPIRISGLQSLSRNRVQQYNLNLNRASSLNSVQSASPVELSQPGPTAPKAHSIPGTSCGGRQ